METNEKGIVRLEEASGVDLSDAIGKAVGVDASGKAVLGGDFGVVTLAYNGGVDVAVFGSNVGPVEVKLAGMVAKGDYVVRNPITGKWTKAAATDIAEARMVQSGVSDELIPAVLLAPAARIGANVFAASDHNHDAAYAAIDHDHDEAYAAIDHTHN